MAEDFSGGEEEVAEFSTDSDTTLAATSYNSKWINEELRALRDTRLLRKIAVCVYGAFGIFLILLSSCLAWRLFDMISSAFVLISYGALSKDELPTSGYIALLSTIPIGATMIAGVSVIAISMKAIRAAAPQNSPNDNDTDTVAAVIKSIAQQQP